MVGSDHDRDRRKHKRHHRREDIERQRREDEDRRIREEKARLFERMNKPKPKPVSKKPKKTEETEERDGE